MKILPQPSKSDVDEIIKTLDSDKNGEVDLVEFKQFVINKNKLLF